MIYEFLVLLVPLVAGCALMQAQGMRGYAVPAFGFLAGLAMQTIVWSLLVFSGLPNPQWLALLLTLAPPVAWWIASRRLRAEAPVNAGFAALVLLFLALGVAFMWKVNLVKWHTDSFNYLIVGSLLAGDNPDALTPGTLAKRMLGMPALHAPSALFGEIYLRTVTPLIAISCLTVLAALTSRGLGRQVSRGQAAVFSIMGVLALVTMNRFVWHSFYLNGHLYFGTLILVLGGTMWLQYREAVADRALLVLQVLAIPMLVVTRPEGTIVAAIMLLPALINERIEWRQRASLLFVLGLSTAVWHACLGWSYHTGGRQIPGYVWAFVVLGASAMLTSPVLAWNALRPWLRFAPTVAETTIWLALLAAALVQPDVFLASVKAAATNALMGGTSWGGSLAMIAVLVIGVLVFTQDATRLALRLPVTTFVPVSLLLAHLREGAYRVSEADSLNRMFIHIVPLAMLLIVSAAGAEWRRFRKRAGPGSEHLA